MRRFFGIFVILGALSAIAGAISYGFKPFESGGFSAIRDSKVFVIRSAADFRAYAKERGREGMAPNVNWNREQLIAVHIGSAPSTGYGVAVKRIVRREPGKIVVDIVETKPAPGTMQAMHVTYPFVVVKTVRFPGVVTFKVVDP